MNSSDMSTPYGRREQPGGVAAEHRRGGGLAESGGPHGPDGVGVTEREGIVAAEQDLVLAGHVGEEPDGLRPERDGVVEQVGNVVRRPVPLYGVAGQGVGTVAAVEAPRLVGQEPA